MGRSPNKLRQSQKNVRISPENPTLIEKNLGGGQFAHAVDIHSIDEPLDITVSQEGAYGFKFGQKPIKIESNRAMPLSEFRTRKAGSILTVQEGDIFNPEPHRMKDIPDFITSQEYLTKVSGRTGDLEKLNTLKGLYKDQLPANPEPIKVSLNAPEIKSPSPSIPVVPPSMGLTMGSPSLKASTSGKSPFAASAASAGLGISKPVSLSSVSRSINLKSPSIGPSMGSPKLSPPVSPSVHPSISPSASLSPSISPSVSLSPKISTSLSASPSMSPGSLPPSIRMPPSGVLGPIGGMREPEGSKKKYSQTKKERKFYVPSLTALATNFKQASGRLQTKGFTGTEIRPIGILRKARRHKGFRMPKR